MSRRDAERPSALDRRTHAPWAGESEPSVGEILARITDGFVALGSDWRFTYANASAQRMLRRSLDELIGQPIWSIMTGEEEQLRDACLHSQATQVPGIFEDYVRELDQWFRVHMYPSPSGMSLFIHDVTDLHRSRDSRRFLLRAGPQLAASLNPDTIAHTASSLVVEEMADWCAIDLAGRTGFVRAAVGEADAEGAALAAVLRSLLPGETRTGSPLASVVASETGVVIDDVPPSALADISVTPDLPGALAHADVGAAMIVPLIARARVLGAMTLLRRRQRRRFSADDLSLMTELAVRIALSLDNGRLYREAVSATSARDEMLGVVTHDLRNPLHTISMAAQMLESTVTERVPESKRWTAMITRAASTMAGLIQDLLEVSRLESGSAALDLRAHACIDLLHEAHAAHVMMAGQSSIHLQLQCDNTLPAVRADRRRIMQVFSNLVTNAVKFTKADGRVTLGASLDGEMVCFTVEDTGVGIAPDAVDAVFGRFWQADSGDARGVGLGLAIAKGIVELHGGRIWVESEIGRGTCFHFTIPVANEPARAGEPPQSR